MPCVDLAALLAAALLVGAVFGWFVAWGPAPRRLGPAPPGAAGTMVSVIVPARNEAHNLPRLLESLSRQTVAAREVIVVDGGGNGDLAALAQRTGARVVAEPPLVQGWVGKSWACAAGRAEASGEWLLFTDADTEYAPDALARAVAEAESARVGLLTGLTRQELVSFAERVAMPPIFALIQSAAGGGGERALADPARAIANGQFLLFRAQDYDALGGHAAVKESIVEDLALARLVAAARVPAAFRALDDAVRVRMYRGAREMFDGWRKNVASGAARTAPVGFVATGATHAAGLLAAPLALAAAAVGAWLAAGLAFGAYAVSAARVFEQRRYAEGPGALHALLHPVGFAFFGVVLLASVFDRVSGRGATWKGRRYRLG